MCGCRNANKLRMKVAYEHIAPDGTTVEYETHAEAADAQRASGGVVRRLRYQVA